ncbi:UDP-N-acetylmuramoyl-tripeptide--D-alanyl-D-alanine ligase [Priestia koreensis]|uniref:UDP-N-acetylmuramoyl-tripeptide--D-alanyl-D- alanine ligase n=1 Tax=Priestia koreensis TaxID=284581 RepID=UPI002412E2E9|nr:UDP-N-acetylmuramoyl-tripeptide--D-alanyl-D-alanine ligase [Priestia koreensis]
MAALQQLAKRYREQLNVKIIGVTGSNGKTTTKDLINSIAETTFRVHKTPGNLNSQIGLPLTILGISEQDEVAVLEMGMSERGQIEKLADIARPDIGVITMIGTSHLSTLGSREEIAKAKLEIAKGIKAKGLFIYNGDEPLLKDPMLLKGIRPLTFGEGTENDIVLSSLHTDSEGTHFTVGGENVTYRVPLTGKHNALNALAAIAVGKELGIPEKCIQRGLRNARITEMRMQKIPSERGFTIINDAWNASPQSVQAAIQTFEEMPCKGRKFIVLGDMLELGDDEVKYHQEVAHYFSSGNNAFLYTYGHLAHHISLAATSLLPVGQVKHFSTKSELTKELQKELGPADMVLVKGSRGMKMEEVVEKLMEETKQ